jgi:hypothetical protein
MTLSGTQKPVGILSMALALAAIAFSLRALSPIPPGISTALPSKAASSNCGVVFKLAPASGSGWTESTMYTFTCLADGGYPFDGNLILDSAGNLYGAAD